MIIPRKKSTIKITLVPSSKKFSVTIKSYTNATLEMTPQQRVEVMNSEGFVIDGKEVSISEIRDAIQIALEQLCTIKSIETTTQHQVALYA